MEEGGVRVEAGENKPSLRNSPELLFCRSPALYCADSAFLAALGALHELPL